jgi:hypothetical protein
MKRVLSLRISIVSIIAFIFFSSCSKEVGPVPISTDSSTVATVSTYPTPSPSLTALYVDASNWVKESEGYYKSTFYGLNGYGNELPAIVRVYLSDQNVVTIISNGSIHYMEGELSASHDKFSVWVSFRLSAQTQTLPFSTLKLKIVF